MRRVRYQDTPGYAADVMDGAKPIGSQVAVTAVLLAAETTMPRQDPRTDANAISQQATLAEQFHLIAA